MHTTHFVANPATPGLQTAYFDTSPDGGDSSIDTVIFVHGFTGSKLDFADQLNWFSDRFRVLAYDQRGHGESSNCGNYTLYAMAADLLGFLDAVGVEQCHVLGHSLGGMVTLRAMLGRPQRFLSTMLMDTAPYSLELIPPATRKQLASLVQAQGCDALLAGMRAQPPNASVLRCIDFFASQSNQTFGVEEYWRRIQVKLEQMDTDAFVALNETIAQQPSVLEAMSTLEMPTTIMVGREDKPFLNPATEMAQRMPNAKLEMIPDAGHSPQYENPEAWRDIVARHLKQNSKQS